MSYAKSVLQPGETIVAIGRLHWIIYRWAMLFLVIGVALVWLEQVYWPDHDRLIAISALVFGGCFLAAFLYAWFIRWITEFAVTTKRVIASRIFISRTTEEMSMDKVETVDVRPIRAGPHSRIRHSPRHGHGRNEQYRAEVSGCAVRIAQRHDDKIRLSN